MLIDWRKKQRFLTTLIWRQYYVFDVALFFDQSRMLKPRRVTAELWVQLLGITLSPPMSTFVVLLWLTPAYSTVVNARWFHSSIWKYWRWKCQCSFFSVAVGRFVMSLVVAGVHKVHELYTAAFGLYVIWLVCRTGIIIASWIPLGMDGILEKVKTWLILVSYITMTRILVFRHFITVMAFWSASSEEVLRNELRHIFEMNF